MEEKKRYGLKKNVLIISYYWPPAGGGGVMRWLKMSKYLFQDSHWNPIVYTPQNAGYLIFDQSLESEIPSGLEVLRLPIVEPNNFLGLLGLSKFKKSVASGGVGKSKKKNPKLEQFLIWIRSNLFIPDPRMFWIRPSVSFLAKVIKEKNIEAIITTGPPHSMHLIGLGLKKKLDIPWIADFRDPWTFIDFFEDLDLSKRAFDKHMKLERKVLFSADQLITVSPSWAEEFEKRNPGIQFKVIYNGFDPQDFDSAKKSSIDKDFTIVHIGSLNKDRNSELFWQCLSELCTGDENFKKKLKVRLIGSVTSELKGMIDAYDLNENVSVEEYQAHEKVIQIMESAQLLLLLINNSSAVGGIIPGKLYEYLGANRPILCVGNASADAGRIIQAANAGKIVGFEDRKAMLDSLVYYFDQYQKEGVIPSHTRNKEKFSRKGEALQFASLLDEISGKS